MVEVNCWNYSGEGQGSHCEAVSEIQRRFQPYLFWFQNKTEEASVDV